MNLSDLFPPPININGDFDVPAMAWDGSGTGQISLANHWHQFYGSPGNFSLGGGFFTGSPDGLVATIPLSVAASLHTSDSFSIKSEVAFPGDGTFSLASGNVTWSTYLNVNGDLNMSGSLSTVGTVSGGIASFSNDASFGAGLHNLYAAGSFSLGNGQFTYDGSSNFVIGNVGTNDLTVGGAMTVTGFSTAEFDVAVHMFSDLTCDGVISGNGSGLTNLNVAAPYVSDSGGVLASCNGYSEIITNDGATIRVPCILI